MGGQGRGRGQGQHRFELEQVRVRVRALEQVQVQEQEQKEGRHFRPQWPLPEPGEWLRRQGTQLRGHEDFEE
jgi:hypothetical protein